MFQLTLPLRGATFDSVAWCKRFQFQLTLPLRGATVARLLSRGRRSCFNSRSPCGERPATGQMIIGIPGVSTHAPLAGSDYQGYVIAQDIDIVSTHAPLAGSDAHRLVNERVFVVSTHAPLAGSDVHSIRCRIARDVSTHAPLAGSDSIKYFYDAGMTIVSTHAPLAGSDSFSTLTYFLHVVSTHAPLAGSDSRLPDGEQAAASFNSRSPCGERPSLLPMLNTSSKFQLTLPLRGATEPHELEDLDDDVSTHAPLAGSDHLVTYVIYMRMFQLTLPLRGATHGDGL